MICYTTSLSPVTFALSTTVSVFYFFGPELVEDFPLPLARYLQTIRSEQLMVVLRDVPLQFQTNYGRLSSAEARDRLTVSQIFWNKNN